MDKQSEKLAYLKEKLKVQVREQFIELLDKFHKQIVYEDAFEKLGKTVYQYKKMIKDEKEK